MHICFVTLDLAVKPLPVDIDAVCVSVGSNVLCRQSVQEAQEDLEELLTVIAQQALSCGGTPPVVILCEVFRRRPGTMTLQGPYKVDLVEYNAKVDAFNGFLKDRAVGLPHRLRFWAHRDVKKQLAVPGMLHPTDGVHLGSVGYYGLCKRMTKLG